MRHIAILKVWVDYNGLRPGWAKALSPQTFDPERWFTYRTHWDDEQIGLLSHPPPPLSQLESDLHTYFHWLRNMTDSESQWATCDQNSRGDVIDAIRRLENGAQADTHLW